ncbi:MAG: hypothetical protein JJU34_17360 [Lunatimonas sp.]|uniref:hypothetical protein n=1 Tax=Lunatimonas sp. TaxID=2060141 RepID=UPI00263AEA8C|nr:hypothetical protein [Lunatimonas sp.]MCC5939051.1 hypothetical protein [Lunatimonas sp.]
MNKFQLLFHNVFKFIWNALFIISYPVLATFGVLFITVTMVFSWVSRQLSKLSNSQVKEVDSSEWERISDDSDLLEGRLYKQIIFGPNCYHFRRRDGIPSVIEDFIFGKKVKVLEEGLIVEKWNTTDIKEIPDFDICLYKPDDDKLTKLTNVKCFDWHLASKQDDFLYFKWFDGIQGGEVKVSITG